VVRALIREARWHARNSAGLRVVRIEYHRVGWKGLCQLTAHAFEDHARSLYRMASTSPLAALAPFGRLPDAAEHSNAFATAVHAPL